ncbi:SLAM family member 9-like isoform 3-T3 [Salvelinus alpinus]
MTTLQYLGISVLFIIDLLGAVNAEVNTLTRRERQSVTLHTGLTGLQADKIFWSFGPVIPNTSIVESQVIRGENITEFKGRFPDRLQLDRQTGSLTIRNLTLNNSGVYQIDIFNTHKTSQRFSLTVYALVPLPQVRKIPEGDFLDSSSEKGSCSVVCSVENRRDMTLSWYRGEKRLNQTSSHDLSTNLSLPLEIKLQDKDIYSCVAANPVSNQTTKLNIETLCLQYVESGPILITVIPIILGLLLLIGLYCIWKKKDIKRVLCIPLRESRRGGLCGVAYSVRPCISPSSPLKKDNSLDCIPATVKTECTF